jgi:hypothetical protein
MASKILESILILTAIVTALLALGAISITLRYRREIYRAEKRRAIEILLRTRTAKDTEPNLREDNNALVGHL